MTIQNAINRTTEDLTVNKVAGDPYINLQISSTDEFVIGLDDDDSDALKINQGGASPSAGTNTWRMSTAGERTMPLQPAFNAYNSAQDANQTGNGAVAVVEFDTEVFDQNADFDNATDTFTAPVTGIYYLNAHVNVYNIGAGSDWQNRIITSNRTYLKTSGINKTGSNTSSKGVIALADMDAADTAYVDVLISGNGANTIGINGNANSWTYFHGNLEC